jgi:hypothetical protein
MKNSGRFPSVDWRTPVTAGPKREPTASVANETIHARPASATVAIANVSSGSAPAKWAMPAAAVTTATAPTSVQVRRRASGTSALRRS